MRIKEKETDEVAEKLHSSLNALNVGSLLAN